MIQIEINAQGGIAMLHDDAVNLSEFGEIEVRRASNVEYAMESTVLLMNGLVQKPRAGWYVQSAKTAVVLADGFETRAEALAWEKTYYSPSGLGWAELELEGE